MKVTDVRVRRFNSEGKMRAIVSVTLNDQFVVHDVRVIEGNSGFCGLCEQAYPSGEFKDIAHPINTAARREIQEAILDVYFRNWPKPSMRR